MAVESHRRVLLAESDYLLDDVEMLRLHDETEAPLRLREAIRALQIRLGRRNPPLPPQTLDPRLALAVADAAWSNYWLLLQDAERIMERLSAARPAGGNLGARRR